MKLRDLLRMEHLSLTVVAAEADQLDREITSAYITDLPDPSRFLSPGDIVLTSGMWASDSEAMERFVGALVRQQVSALVIGLVQIGHVPDALLDVCRREKLTLLTIAGGVSFKQVVDAVAMAGAGAGQGLAQKALEFSRRLAEVQARGEGMPAILSEFDAGFGASCWVIDARGTLRAAAGEAPDREQSAFVWNAMFDRDPSDGVVLVARSSRADAGAEGPEQFTCWPISTAEGKVLGYFVCAADQRRLVRDLPIVVDGVVGALRTDLEFAERWREQSSGHVSELVRALADDSAPPGEISARMRMEGLDPQHPTLIVLADVADARFPAGTVLEIAHHIFAAGEAGAIGTVVDGQAVLIVNGPSLGVDEEMVHDRAAEWLPLLRGRQLRIGASDPRAGVGQLATAYASARARLIHVESTMPVALSATSEIRTYRALLAQLSETARNSFARDALRPLRDYDSRHGADLVSTLRVFLANSGAWQQTARQLHLHTNTLRYRIARVEELTGRSLSSMDDRVDIYLALQLTDD